MYRVLLVDDEKLVLRSLASGVDWEASGFCIAGKATNASIAMQYVQELKPHVVFTDIRMPGLSGLELIKQIKELDPDIQVIVISGYAEFAYVQKSLHYGVLGYCLKPFDDHEIGKLLETAAANLNDIAEKRANKLLDMLEGRSTTMTENAFNRLLIGAGLTSDQLHLLVVIGDGQLTFSTGTRWIAINLGKSRTVYLTQLSSADQEAFAATGMDRTVLAAGILGVGAVHMKHSLEGLRERIEQGTLLAWNFFISGRFDIYFESPERQLHDATAVSLIRRLEQAAFVRSHEQVSELLDEMLASRASLTIHHALKIYNIVYFHFAGRLPEEEYIFNMEQLYHLHASFSQMIASLKAYMHESRNGTSNDYSNAPSLSLPSSAVLSRGTGSTTEHANLKEIILFLNDNYHNQISIQSISKKFYLHPNYLSQLFKREIKVTFTEYLTGVRLQEAKNLLRTTSLPIGEVADRIGFRDYFYFTRLFKKNTQQTPKQYRMTYHGIGEE
ncbi:response regulator [Paenibacillus albus]|uniref:Response regulator n=1 Tax=Paenibacillus albus TaxID=2495582 RepID=A0A3S9A838_9BACL|nr:response regulator [Paenibacillus albus]AZN41881.1 response regulator [Paenibacillus albus]